MHGITDSLLGLALDEGPIAGAQEGQPRRAIFISRPLGGLEAQLASLTRELEGVDLLNED